MKTLSELHQRMVGMKTCHEVGLILQDYLDGDLDRARVSMVSAHLEQCRRCGMEADAYRRIKDSLARIGREGRVHPEDRLSVDRLRRFADSLRN
ncbi:MAG: zf-HC2 domain-containing protein [Actinomycetota bacterium]|nr:zf-HC2 domain-containing protein [Actinomycetota bacterium]MDA8367257.1 zf-HC2 domain-containing protein [Actinomycetota bacterium]